METKEVTMEARMAALASHLDCCADELREESRGGPVDALSLGSKEYLVLTDEEADDMAHASIVDSLWAFNPGFVAAHTERGLTNKAQDALGEMQGKLCEGANEIVRAMIEDIDSFVEDAIGCDGRGHFLSGYDGEEIELDGGLFCCRIN